MTEWKKTMSGWYCQPDGGQHNVLVQVLHAINLNGTDLITIFGDGLISPVQVDGEGVLIVPSAWLHTEPQDYQDP